MNLFFKLFLTLVGMHLLLALTLAGVIVSWQEEQVLVQTENRLRNVAAILRDKLADQFNVESTAVLQPRIRRLGQETDLRLTLVASDGVVIAESQRETLEGVRAMEDHRDRPELVAAAETGTGRDERTSPTLGSRFLYYALRMDRDGEPVGFVRASVPVSTIQDEVARIRRSVWTAAGVLSLVGVLPMWLIASRLDRRISVLVQTAETIARGDYQQDRPAGSRDKLGDLAESLDRMRQRLARRERDLRDAGDRLSALLDGMEEGVLAVDPDGKILFANAAAGALLGFANDHAVGKSLRDCVRQPSLQERLETPAATGGLQIELGDERLLEGTVSKFPGKPDLGVIFVLRDVTELRRLESLRQEFVANVSHELKTPLSAIKAYAETLLSGALNDSENNERFVQRIDEQAERLHELILDMIQLARLDSGQQTYEITSVGVARVARECLADRRDAAEVKQIALRELPHAEDLEVRADEEGLRRIMDNLLDNAIKYTPEGGQVTVAWERLGEQGVVTVQDTGIGIAEADQARIFERFYRVDKARSRELGGTGLGLSIVKHLAQFFGGTVSVSSERACGTTFTVNLPIAQNFSSRS